MYYEVTVVYTSGKISNSNYEPQEINDMRAYCNEGLSGGWIESYDVTQHEEEY